MDAHHPVKETLSPLAAAECSVSDGFHSIDTLFTHEAVETFLAYRPHPCVMPTLTSFLAFAAVRTRDIQSPD